MKYEVELFNKLERLESKIDRLLAIADPSRITIVPERILPVRPDNPSPTIPEDEITRNLSYEDQDR